MDSEDRFEWGPWLVMMAIAIAGIACLFLAMTTETKAQGQRCGPLGQIESELKDRFKEARIGHGLVNPTTVLLFYATDDGKTWTILSVNHMGIACMVSSGTDLDLSSIKPGRAV